jgi:carboxyl-terminal processing protease
VDDAMLSQFEDFLRAQKVEFTDKDIKDNLDWIKSSIKAELFTSQFGQAEGLKVRAEWDPQIKQALTYMPEALALEEHKLPSEQKTTETATTATAQTTAPTQNGAHQ